MNKKFKILTATVFGALALAAVPAVAVGCGAENTSDLFEHEHEFEWVLKTPATCTSAGEEIQKCRLCLQEGESRATEKLAHAYVYVTLTLSDCVTHGLEKGICAVCGAEEEPREIALGDHTGGGTWYFDEAKGTHYQLCTVCGERTDEEEHSATEWIATAAEHYRICETCGAKFGMQAHTAAADAVWESDPDHGTHFHLCEVCDSRMDETDCSADGTAYEIDAEGGVHYRICAACGGKFNVGEHEISAIYKSHDDSATHIRDCRICGLVMEETQHHLGEYHLARKGTCFEQTTYVALCQDCNYESRDYRGYVHSDQSEWHSDDTGTYQLCPDCGARFNVQAAGFAPALLPERKRG